jgi:putative ABC transport system permease protein
MKSLTRGHLKAGFDSVRKTKWRNFWTMLGVIIGVASVISVVGIGDGIKQQISSQLQHSDGNVIVVRPSAISGSSNNPLSAVTGFDVTGTLDAHDGMVVGATSGVGVSAPLSAITAKVSGNQKTYDSGLVIGSNPALPGLLNQSVAYGSFLTSQDILSNDVVLGATAANDLFNESVPIGQSLSINGQQFTVVGIMNAFPSTLLSQNADYNNAVFIPYSVAQGLTNNTAPTFEILARPSHPKQIKSVVANIKHALTSAHGGQTDFSVTSGDQNLTNTSKIFSLLTEMITGVAAISLIVGGIGIMNVMLVSVTERMHEIGIRKAIGATNRQILSQFMIESTMLSFSGGVIGIIVSLILNLVLRLTTSLEPSISWQIVLLATGVSIVIGVIFGSVPALKAARKDPISALRIE